MFRLRKAIMPLHDEAEKLAPLRAIPARTITMEAYSALLKRLCGFLLPAEQAIGDGIGSELLAFDYANRKRVPHLEKDLAFIGVPEKDLEVVPRFSDLPHLATLSQVLGCLYLFEGSRLGGLVLAKALKEQFGFDSNKGCSYFGSDGLSVPELWTSFQEAMEDYLAGGGDGDEIISSAVTRFSELNQWLTET